MSECLKLDSKFLQRLEEEWSNKIEGDAAYWRENEAKLRAVTSVETYDEFRNIVKAAHLQPLETKELSKLKSTRRWNFLEASAKASHTGNYDYSKHSPFKGFKDKDVPCPQTTQEFCSTWQKLADQQRLPLLKSIPTQLLQFIFKADIGPNILEDLSKILQQSTNDDIMEQAWLLQLLIFVTKSTRFRLNLQFLSVESKEAYRQLLTCLTSQDAQVLRHLSQEFEL